MIIGFIKKELVVFIAGIFFAVSPQVWGMDYEKEAKIERHAQSFLGRTWTPEKKREIVETLRAIPSSDLESVVTQVHSLRIYMGKSSKVRLIRTVAQMPSHERSSLCREIYKILQILGPEQTQEQYYGVISYVRETPLLSREGLSDCLKQLNFVSSHGWYVLLEAIKEIEGIPQHERRDFSDLVGSFRFERELIEGIRYLKSFSHQERRPFRDFSLSFLDGIPNFRNKLALIKEVEDIPSDERRDFSDLVRFFRFENGLIEGIRCLKSLSHQERRPFKDFTVPFLEKLPDIKNKLEFIREIKDVPQDERSDFADLVGSFQFDSDLMEGIRSLKSVPPQARRPFKDFALPLIETLTNIKHRSFIINWLLDIPLDDRETVFSTWNGLSLIFLEFNRLSELSGVIALINFARELSKEERVTTEWGSFSSYVLPFLSLGNSSQDKKSILKKLYSLPQSERDPFKELVFSFLNLRSEDWGKFKVIEAFIEVLPQERENIALHLRHVTPHFSDLDLSKYLRDISKLSEEAERENFTKMVMAFSYDSGLLQIFQKILPSEIPEVQACLISLRKTLNFQEGSRKISSVTPSCFLEALLSTPEGMRLEAQEFALFLLQSFFKKTNSLIAEREVIETLKYGALFSSEQRMSFRKCFPYLECHDFGTAKEIMEALKKSPLEDQESVARHVSPLIREKSSSYGFGKVFEDVRETPPEQRERAIRNSRDFLVKSASRWGDENRKIYRSLRFFPEEGLSILQKTLERLIPETTGRSKDRIMIMERLAKVLPHHMESIGNYTLSLSWPEIKGEEKGSLIEAISKIPPEEREGLFKTFQGLSEMNFTSQQKLELLGFFQETSDQEFKSLVDLTKPFIMSPKRRIKQFSQKDFVPFLKVFKGISFQERDHFQACVLKIITTSHGEPENKLSLAKMVSKMASHEWDEIAEIALSLLKKVQEEEAFLEDPEESEEERAVEDVRSHYRGDPSGDAFYKMRDRSRYGDYEQESYSYWDGHERYEQEHYDNPYEDDYDEGTVYGRGSSYATDYQRKPGKTVPKQEEEKEDSRNPLLEAFWGIPPSDRDLLRSYVHSLVAPYMTLKDILFLIENVRDISPKDRETIHPSLLSLLEASEKTTTEIINLMKILSRMKKSEQENITHHTHFLLKMIKMKEEAQSFSRMLDFCEESLQNLFSEDGSSSCLEASSETLAEEDFKVLANDFEQSHSLKARDKRHNYPKTYTLSAVVEAFLKIPLKDRDDVCHRTQAMAESFIEGKDLGALVEIVQVILPEKRAVTQRLLSKLVKCSLQMSPSDFLESAKVLGNLSCDDQESVMDQVVPFLKTTCLLTRQNQHSFHLWNEGKKSPLLVAFSKISVSDREDLNTYLRSLLPLLTNPFDVPEIAKLIALLGTVSQDNRVFVQPHLLKLSQTSQISSKDLRDLIRVLRLLPPEEKENLAEQGMAFVTKRILEEAFSLPISSKGDQKKVYSKWNYLFGTLRKISAVEREETSLAVQALLTPSLGVRDVLKLMELFRGVSKEEKESLINFVLSVSPSHKDQEDGAYFRSDSSSRRVQLLELAKQLSPEERILILPLTLHISSSSGAGNQVDLIQKTSQLIRETAPESQEFLLILLKDLYDLQKERVETPSSYYVGMRQNSSDFLKSVKDIPSSDREIILSLSLQLAKPQMNLHHLRTLFQRLQSVSPEDRESIVADTRLLSSTAMDQEDRAQRRSFSGGEHSKVRLLEGLRRFPTIQRESLILMTLHLVAPHMNVHDRLRIMESLSRVSSEQRETRVQEVMLRLSEDIFHHEMSETERFSRIIQLLENPRASFTRRSIYVTGDEALMQERQAVVAIFRQLLSHPSTASLISKNLPSRDEFFESYCANFLKNLDLLSRTVRGPQEQFRLLKAKEGIEHLRKIRAEFSIDSSIPSIRKIFGLVYNLVNTGFTTKTFIEAWIVEKEVSNSRDWEQFKVIFSTSFPDLMGHETAGRILEADKEKGKRFVRCLRSMIEDEEIEISFKERVYLKRIMKDYCVAFKERNTPLIEALLMSVRGHNRNLLDPRELNRYACADGVMVGILRSLAEIRETQEISRPLALIEKVSCQ